MTRLLLAASTALALATGPAAAVTFNYTGAIVTWTVPQTGTYEIVAVGAQGGAGALQPSFSGGLGALIGGYFTLSSSDVLQLAAGGMGASGSENGGGGGGSFVVGGNNLPLVIAGGGGGIRRYAGQNGWNANTGTEGLTGSGSFTTGGGVPLRALNGSGGPAGPTSLGSGGGGFFTNGDNDGIFGTGGASWTNLLAGGTAADLNGCNGGGNGGFGGGGAGAGCFGGGGGGGYSGGQGGLIAGGGGSFNAAPITGWAQAGVGTGNGYITINLVVEEVTTPEPASAALSLLGFFALAALRRRR